MSRQGTFARPLDRTKDRAVWLSSVVVASDVVIAVRRDLGQPRQDVRACDAYVAMVATFVFQTGTFTSGASGGCEKGGRLGLVSPLPLGEVCPSLRCD